MFYVHSLNTTTVKGLKTVFRLVGNTASHLLTVACLQDNRTC